VEKVVKLKRINEKEKGHILIKTDEPLRLEITKTKKGYLVYGYKGTKTNFGQKPILFFET